MPYWKTIAAALLAAALSTGASAGDDKRLEQCQRLKDAIESYTAKRRAGGSASQMDRWKEARREKKAQWSALRCRELRSQLD